MTNLDGTYLTEELSPTSIVISNGYAYVHLIDKGSGIFLLDTIYGPGEGKALLTLAIYEAKRRGGNVLQLNAVASAEYISQEKLESFYKKFGFQEDGVRRKSGTIRMKKSLSDFPLIQPSVLEEILQKNNLSSKLK